MPITDRAKTAVYSALPAGSWRVLSERPRPNPAGFDRMEVTWICDFKGVRKTAAEIVAMFPAGARYDAGNDEVELWLREASPRNEGGNVWTCEAAYEGSLAPDKPAHVVLLGASGAESFIYTAPSGTGVGATTFWTTWLPFPITINPGRTLAVAIRENTPGFEYSYYQRGTPRTDLVGLGQFGGLSQVVPPVPVPVRTFPWESAGGSGNWRVNVPAGFIFEDLRTDPIPGTPQAVNWVTEAWNFSSIYKPVS
ncbi:MAG: hypothetical protein HS117_19220 [Verrucomicrobiaceae bacterium]|nr:hypothetical protein [Verrucomicrobiaceae bacterium]